MLKWLSSKPDHPMYNVKAAEKVLAELSTANPAQALEEVSGWIESVSQAPDFKADVRIAVLQLLEDFGRKLQHRLIEDYLGAARIHDLKARERCQKAYDFWAALSAAYAQYLEHDLDIEGNPRCVSNEIAANVICCALRCVGAQERVRHVSYRAVDKEVWVRLARLFRMAETASVENCQVKAHKSDVQVTSPAQELLRPLMLEVGAPEALAPEHVELAARTIASISASFAIGKEPSPALAFCFDLENPGRPVPFTDKTPATPTLRCFGPGEAVQKLEELLRLDGDGGITAERKPGLEFTAWDRATAFKHLKRYWGPERPSRRTNRTRAEGELSVLHSLDAIRTVVTQIGTDQIEAIAETMSECTQQLRLVPEGSDQAPEIWTEKDVSAGGIGAQVPSTCGPWVRVGRICALKRANSAAWWVGVIRRLDATLGARVTVGLEVLSRTPYSLWLKKVGVEGGLASVWATSSGSMRYDYVDAILLVAESDAPTQNPNLVIRPKDFKPDLVCEALIGEKQRLIKFGNTVETGDDFLIIACSWL